MTRAFFRTWFLLLLSLAAPSAALAAQSYDNCTGFITSLPASITTQGTWCLKQDLATALSSGGVITINTNNVTIDCNNFKLGGLAAGLATQAFGIYSLDRVNITVRQCNIRGFYIGLLLSGASGGGHLVENNRFDGNAFEAIAIEGDGSIVRNNLVSDTGGSTAFANSGAVGIASQYSVDILDNTVFGVTATSGGNGGAVGINTASDDGGSVGGNRVRGLLKAGTGTATGIYNSFSDRIAVFNNNLFGPGDMGIHCFGTNGSMRDNLISGFTATTDNCTDNGGNAVIP